MSKIDKAVAEPWDADDIVAWIKLATTDPDGRRMADNDAPRVFPMCAELRDIATTVERGAAEASLLADALTALQACIDQIQQDTHMLYVEYAQSAQMTGAEKLARAVLARSAAPQEGAVEAAVLAEREACAKVIEQHCIMNSGGEKFLRPRPDGDVNGLAYADAIRARSASHKPGSGS